MQHPIADALKHALVIPVIERELLEAMSPEKICPIVTIEGQPCVAMTHMMAGIPLKELGTLVADLTHDRDELCGAVDFMIQGYSQAHFAVRNVPWVRYSPGFRRSHAD